MDLDLIAKNSYVTFWCFSKSSGCVSGYISFINRLMQLMTLMANLFSKVFEMSKHRVHVSPWTRADDVWGGFAVP